jgi:hypothetical protein
MDSLGERDELVAVEMDKVESRRIDDRYGNGWMGPQRQSNFW